MAVGKLRKRQGSKKTKKGWRKADIQDVEDFLEDKRLEERLGYVNLEVILVFQNILVGFVFTFFM